MEQQDQQDHQDQVEHQEVLVLQGIMEPRDQLVYQVMPARWVILVTTGQQDSLELLVLLVWRGQGEQMDVLVPRDRLETKDQLVHQGREVPQDNQEQPGNQDPLVVLDLKERLGMQGHKVHRDQEEVQALRDLQVKPALQDPKDLVVSLALQGPREPVDQLDQMVSLAIQGLRALLVQLVQLDK